MEFPKLGFEFVDDKDFERTRTPLFEVFLGLARHLSRRFAMRAMESLRRPRRLEFVDVGGQWQLSASLWK